MHHSCAWKKQIHRTGFMMVLLLFALELAVLSGRIQMASYLPCEAEQASAHSAICSFGMTVPVAALAAKGGAEAVLRMGFGEERISERAVSRTCIFVCGVFLLCLYQVLRRLLYKLSDQKSYRSSKYTISYIYHLTHL